MWQLHLEKPGKGCWLHYSSSISMLLVLHQSWPLDLFSSGFQLPAYPFCYISIYECERTTVSIEALSDANIPIQFWIFDVLSLVLPT